MIYTRLTNPGAKNADILNDFRASWDANYVADLDLRPLLCADITPRLAGKYYIGTLNEETGVYERTECLSLLQ